MSGFVKAGFSFLKNLGKGQKTTGTEVISSVKPNVPKTKIDKAKSLLSIAKQKTKASQAKLDNTIFRINQQKKRLEEKKAKGGRVGLKGGADAGKIPTTPKEKKFAAIAEPKNRITYRDKIEGAKKRG